jgi:hypothetical protein
MYGYVIIQKAVNAMWFKNKHDEGVVFTDKFSPVPVPAIALLLMAVCFLFIFQYYGLRLTQTAD